MARVLVEIPRVGLVMETARLLRWLKSVGDTVAQGDPLVEIETEKAVVEIEATVAGRLAEILVQADQEVAVGARIAWVEDGKSETVAAAPSAPARAPAAAPVPAALPAMAPSSTPRSSPAARRLAVELGVNLAEVAGTGPGGSIQLQDVQRHSDAPKASASVPAGTAARLPLSHMRRAMARAVSLSNASIPQFVIGRSVDWTEVLAFRKTSAPGLSANDFLLQAAARALIEFPAMNGIFVGDANSAEAHIQPASGAHIGLVVALADGMVVPVFHGIDGIPLTELARRRAELVERARNGRLRQEEAGGATFTISNLGAKGPDWFTAILNPPESGILAVGRMREAPVVREGEVVVRALSQLTLTVDHRLADGKLAADFLGRMAQILESRDWR